MHPTLSRARDRGKAAMALQPRSTEVLPDLIHFALARGPMIIVTAGVETQFAAPEQRRRNLCDGILA